jgi:hemerythrin
MAALPWKDEYCVNVSVIDEQHRRLAELVNRLHEAFECDKTGENVFIALNELIGFTRLHFATEEELMLKYEYPDYAAHRMAHKTLLSGLQSLLTTLRDRSPFGFVGGNDINDDWVTKHLLESDVALGNFLNNKGVF